MRFRNFKNQNKHFYELTLFYNQLLNSAVMAGKKIQVLAKANRKTLIY